MSERAPRMPILVTGASGFLGRYVCDAINPSNWDIHGTFSSNPSIIAHGMAHGVNLASEQELVELFKEIHPRGVIHCAAISDTSKCQQDTTLSEAVNVNSSILLAKLCAEERVPMVFVSSDLVFDGKDAPYIEEDEVNPLSLYGEQKARAEQGVMEHFPLACVCRVPLLFGNTSWGVNNHLKFLLQSMQEKKLLKLFEDEFRTPASGPTVARGLLLALEEHTGLLHLGGAERLSRYEFGLLVRQVYGLKDAPIQAVKQADVKLDIARPQDVSLDSEMAFDLGYEPLSVEEELQELREEVGALLGEDLE